VRNAAVEQEVNHVSTPFHSWQECQPRSEKKFYAVIDQAVLGRALSTSQAALKKHKQRGVNN